MRWYARFLFAVCIWSVGHTLLIAQNLCSSDGCAEPWSAPTYVNINPLELPFAECTISYIYEWRICNGVIEYRYHDVSTSGNCDFLLDTTILETNFSALNEWIDLHILQSVFNEGGNYTSIPPSISISRSGECPVENRISEAEWRCA